MDRILFISLNEPCKFGGHKGGPVILVNDILSAIDADMNVDLVVFKQDAITSELPENIKFLPWSQISKRSRKRNITSMFPKGLYKDYSCYTLDVSGYDKVIYYPYFSALFHLEHCHAKIYTIGMDSGPMVYLRGFNNHKNISVRLFSLYELVQALAIDKKATSVSKKVFTVGEADAEFYRSIYQADARFIPHPVTELINGYTPVKWEDGEKLKLCFPGGMTRFYVKGMIESIIDMLVADAHRYKNTIEISFLGDVRYKQLKSKLDQLEASGIQISYTQFAESFEEYLSNQHVILLPLAVGAGTKNKALSTFGMGLDLIGTPIAVENVYGVKKEHIARNAGEMIRLINVRLENRKLYGLSDDEIVQFKKYHSIEKWNEYFWKLIKSELD